MINMVTTRLKIGDIWSIIVLGEHCLMQNISTKERGGAFETAMGHLPLFLSDETAKTNVPPSKAIHADFISTFCRPLSGNGNLE